MSEHYLELQLIEETEDGRERPLGREEIRALPDAYRLKLLETAAAFLGISLKLTMVAPDEAEAREPEPEPPRDGGD
jgi:hypothetical protein